MSWESHSSKRKCLLSRFISFFHNNPFFIVVSVHPASNELVESDLVDDVAAVSNLDQELLTLLFFSYLTLCFLH